MARAARHTGLYLLKTWILTISFVNYSITWTRDINAFIQPPDPPRNSYMTRKFLSLLAILYGLIYFFYESWYHFNFSQSVLNLSIDYLAIILLLVAGIVNLRTNNGEGLLCGAWGFTACLMMRAFSWRHDTNSLGIEESKVMSLLIFAIAVSTVAFCASLIQSFPRSQKWG